MFYYLRNLCNLRSTSPLLFGFWISAFLVAIKCKLPGWVLHGFEEAATSASYRIDDIKTGRLCKVQICRGNSANTMFLHEGNSLHIKGKISGRAAPTPPRAPEGISNGPATRKNS
jgi:hypothetical protein